jgi:chemotaxis protein CheD
VSEQAHKDVVLQIGEFHFGGGRTRIRTLLGSCVSIVLWHPGLQIGGMCHYLLPRRGTTDVAQRASEGNYAEGAMQLFMRELRRTRTLPREYVAKLFGGGCMFKDRNDRGDAFGVGPAEDEQGVAMQNVQAGRELLSQHGFTIMAEQVGGLGSRILIFEVWSGDVWVRRGGPLGARSVA